MQAAGVSIVDFSDSAVPYPAPLGRALVQKLPENQVVLSGGAGVLSVFPNSRTIHWVC